MEIEKLLEQSWRNLREVSEQLLEDAAELMDRETVDVVRYNQVLADCCYKQLQTKRYLKR
ncbi:MAG: hypothetical protein ABIA37_00175 [Candidatus Woesearchaeota archaeon]